MIAYWCLLLFCAGFFIMVVLCATVLLCLFTCFVSLARCVPGGCFLFNLLLCGGCWLFVIVWFMFPECCLRQVVWFCGLRFGCVLVLIGLIVWFSVV